jgi:hypothetical protein
MASLRHLTYLVWESHGDTAWQVSWAHLQGLEQLSDIGSKHGLYPWTLEGGYRDGERVRICP